MNRPIMTMASVLLSVPFLVVAQTPVAPTQPTAPTEQSKTEAPGEAKKLSGPDGDNNQSVHKEFSAALDKMELEIAQQERSSDYGNEKVEAYARELEAEYFSNQATMSEMSATGSPDRELRRREINSRQQHISMLLWQLARVGSEIAKPDSSSRTMLTEMQKLLSKHRQVMTDRVLMKRYQDVMRRAADLAHSRLRQQVQPHSFHFVRPTPSASSAASSADGIAAAPSPSDPKPRIAQGPNLPLGPLQTLQAPIGNLVRLSWNKGQLQWDEKHWETPFVGHSLQSIMDQVNSELHARAVELPKEDRTRAFQTKRLLETPPVMLLFQDLQHIASRGNPPSRSSSTTGSTSRSRFTTKEFEASLTVSPQKLELSIREETGPARALDVRQKNKNELRVSLIGEHILLLEQAADGSVRWVDIGDEVTVIQAKSFAQLYAKHADKIESELYPRLEHCGIETPMKRYDSQVVRRILERMKGVDPQIKTQFSELLTMIDSGSFGERQKAYRELSTNTEKYCLLLAETSDDDGRSAEATARLAELRKKYAEQFGKLDDLIQETGWLTDPSYLSGLVHKVDQQHASMINKHLQRLGH